MRLALTLALSTATLFAQSAPPACATVGDFHGRLHIQVSEEVARALLIKRVDPACPASCESAQKIVLRVTINEKGQPATLCLFSGPASLLTPSIEAVRQWRFKPYLHDGVGEPIITQITLTYPPTP